MTESERELGCLAVALFFPAIPAAYICWAVRGQPLSRLRYYSAWVAGCGIVGFPLGVAVGYFDALWPYGHGYPPSAHVFNWGTLVLDLGIALVITAVAGVGLGFLFTRYWPEVPARPSGPGLANVGPRWSDRPGAPHPPPAAQPADVGFSDDSPPGSRLRPEEDD